MRAHISLPLAILACCASLNADDLRMPPPAKYATTEEARHALDRFEQGWGYHANFDERDDLGPYWAAMRYQCPEALDYFLAAGPKVDDLLVEAANGSQAGMPSRIRALYLLALRGHPRAGVLAGRLLLSEDRFEHHCAHEIVACALDVPEIRKQLDEAANRAKDGADPDARAWSILDEVARTLRRVAEAESRNHLAEDAPLEDPGAECRRLVSVFREHLDEDTGSRMPEGPARRSIYKLGRIPGEEATKALIYVLLDRAIDADNLEGIRWDLLNSLDRRLGCHFHTIEYLRWYVLEGRAQKKK